MEVEAHQEDVASFGIPHPYDFCKNENENCLIFTCNISLNVHFIFLLFFLK